MDRTSPSTNEDDDAGIDVAVLRSLAEGTNTEKAMPKVEDLFFAERMTEESLALYERIVR